jgi:hypothetical protein
LQDDKRSTTKPTRFGKTKTQDITREDDSQKRQRESMTVGGKVPTVGSLYLRAKGTRAQSKGDAIELTEYSTKHSGERKADLGQNRVTLYLFPTVSTLAQGLSRSSKDGDISMSG